MKIVVLHQAAGPDADIADEDVLVQRDAVLAALQCLGHAAAACSCTLDLEATRQRLMVERPDVVFNLVESLGGADRLMVLTPLLLESLGIACTGANSRAILATSNKTAAKLTMLDAGLPTPEWISADQAAGSTSRQRARGMQADWPSDVRWIVKPVWEHASVDMDDSAVVTAPSQAALQRVLAERTTTYRRPYFAERFIDGREFNLSLLAGHVLPAAEIDFSTFPADKPRIVGRAAKWEPDSFEYQQTPREFDFAASDTPLLSELQRLATACWDVFGLSGWARVDFRVDHGGRPFILEVNANPCLAPDAGFAAALTRAGLTFDTAIHEIVQAAV